MKLKMGDTSRIDLQRDAESLRKRLAVPQRAPVRRKKSKQQSRTTVLEEPLARTDVGTPAWFAGLVHEMKQPLTAIISYTSAAKCLLDSGGADPAELRHALEQASLQAERAAELLKNMRRVSVPAAMQRAPTRIADLIREAVQSLEGELKSAHIHMEIRGLAGTLEVVADAFQIRIVLHNLLRNAIEAIVRGGGNDRFIRIAVEERPAAIEVSVRDTGEGLALQTVHNLFEPFHTTKPEGTGLGLALSRAIIQAHGGRLSAKSHTHRGTTFSFTLPQKRTP